MPRKSSDRTVSAALTSQAMTSPDGAVVDLPSTMWLICRTGSGHLADRCIAGSPRCCTTDQFGRRPGSVSPDLLRWTGSRPSARLSAMRECRLRWGPKWESQRAQTAGHVRRRPASIVLGKRHAGRRQATSGDWVELIWEQEAAGSKSRHPDQTCRSQGLPWCVTMATQIVSKPSGPANSWGSWPGNRGPGSGR